MEKQTLEIAAIAMKNATVAMDIQDSIIKKFDEEIYQFHDKFSLNVLFLKKHVKDIIENHSSNLNYTQEFSWCKSEQDNCTAYRVFAFNIVYFPYEALKYKYSPGLGFGTFLAYFSQYFGSTKFGKPLGLLLSHPLDSDAKSIRHYMAKVLVNMNHQIQLSNLTIYDLVQMLQDNAAGLRNSFARPIQNDYGCKDGYNGTVDQFRNAWIEWTNDNSEEFPCINKKSFFYSCCELSQLLQPEIISIALQAMKYAIQPVTYYDQVVQPIFRNLSFLMYENIAQGELDVLLVNRNARIPMCKYAGNPKQLDPKKCKLFHASFTDEGIGYTFNNVNFWNLFRKYNYSETFAEIIQPKGYTDFSHNGLYYGVKSPMSSGPAYGVEMVIERHHIYDQLKNNREDTFKIAIHDPASIAMLSTSSVEVKPGQITTFLITPKTIEASEGLRDIHIEKKNCRFHDEVTDSDLFSIYTQNNCRYECKMRQAVQKCQCIPWDYPQFKSKQHPICNKFSRNCFQQVMTNAEAQRNCLCPNDCSITIYDYSVSSTDISHLCYKSTQIYNYLRNQYQKGFIKVFEDAYFWEEGAQVRDKEAWTWSCEDTIKNIAVVKFQIANQLVTKVKLTPRVSFADTLSNIGKYSQLSINAYKKYTMFVFRRNSWTIWWH